MTNSRKQHGIGSLAPDEKIVGKPGGIVEAGVKQYGIFKKIKKGIKKVVGSKLGKAALLGAGAYFAPMMWGQGAGFSGWGKGIGMLRNKMMGSAVSNAARAKIGSSMRKPSLFKGALDWMGKHKGQTALLGLGAAGMAAPFFAKGDEEEEEDDWSVTPSSIANIRNMARNRDPSLAFLPPANYTQSGYYLAGGGLAGLANGGQPAQAQAEQMLKMEYQKYRNQGGTMSYQQFKMAVLQQAQGQGPMAQGQ